MNSPGGEVFLGIRRGGVLPGSPNPGPISGPQSCFFPHPFPDLASKIYTSKISTGLDDKRIQQRKHTFGLQRRPQNVDVTRGSCRRD